MMNDKLRLIFSTQSGGLQVFWNLHQALAGETTLGRCGFMVTNRYEYPFFLKGNPGFESGCQSVIKEWDILETARRMSRPDREVIARWEKEIGDPTLWHALIMDRRLGYGLRAQFRQFYKPAYSHEAQLCILQAAIERLAAHMDEVRPHAVVGLVPVSLYDYLHYLLCRQRGIPYFYLHLSRIRNYVSLFTDPFELSPHVADVFRRLTTAPSVADREIIAFAETIRLQVRNGTLTYEGSIKKREKGGMEEKPSRVSLMRRLPAMLRRAWLALTLREPHYPSFLEAVFYRDVIRPWRRHLTRFTFDVKNEDEFIREHEGRYAVFPLNTEPEAAILTFARPYRNQIETARNIAASLPVSWKLLVKEHPYAWGYRNANYYRKLREIPNVALAGPNADTGRLIDSARLVFLTYGTIGLEALIKGKPLVVFNRAPYGVFPQEMVRYAGHPWRLAEEVQDLLARHTQDDGKVTAFIAAHVATGIPLNLYTELLGKGGRETHGMGRTVDEQYGDLAQYLKRRVAEETQRLKQRLPQLEKITG